MARSGGNKLSKMTAPRAPRITAREKRNIERYEVQDAISTLTRAEQIRKDRALMREVTKTANQVAEIAKRK